MTTFILYYTVFACTVVIIAALSMLATKKYPRTLETTAALDATKVVGHLLILLCALYALFVEPRP